MNEPEPNPLVDLNNARNLLQPDTKAKLLAHALGSEPGLDLLGDRLKWECPECCWKSPAAYLYDKCPECGALLVQSRDVVPQNPPHSSKDAQGIVRTRIAVQGVVTLEGGFITANLYADSLACEVERLLEMGLSPELDRLVQARAKMILAEREEAAVTRRDRRGR